MVDEIPKGKLILLMADQNPSNVRDAIWVKFFNKETACLHGLEKYSKTYNLPVIYMGMQRVKRSLYTLEFTLLVENPAACKYGEITQRFMSMLEKQLSMIRRIGSGRIKDGNTPGLLTSYNYLLYNFT